MCTGRVDLSFVVRAFKNGMDGVFLAGCLFNDCNYVTHGNYHALDMVLMAKKIMEKIGLNPERLKMSNMSAGEGNLLADLMTGFAKEIKEIGPLGVTEGLSPETLKFRIQSVADIVPFIRLVERERMRMPKLPQSADAYYEYFASADFEKLFTDTVMDKLIDSQIISLLKEKGPSLPGEIVETLAITPSVVSRHLNSLIRQGLVSYKPEGKQFAAAA